MDATGAAVRYEPTARLSTAAVIGVATGVLVSLAARTGAVTLLLAVGVVQVAVSAGVAYGLRVPGRGGAFVLGVAASAASDTVVSVWPHSRLAPLLAVLGLAVPAMFVHQLTRGAGRVRIDESLGGAALVATSVVAVAALIQVRHSLGGDAAYGVAGVTAVALVIAALTDLVAPAVRFDAEVRRGLVAVVAATVFGAGEGVLGFAGVAALDGARAVLVGAAVGAVTALLAVAAAFVDHGVPAPVTTQAARLRVALGVLVPFALVQPAALLLCLAVRR